MTAKVGARWVACGAAVSLTGCATNFQSSVDGVSAQAARIAQLMGFFFIFLAAIFAIVMAFALWTLTRRHRGIDQEPLERTHQPAASTETRLRNVTLGATLATTVILFGLLIASVAAGASVSNIKGSNGLVIRVTGNEWWWSVTYAPQDPQRMFTTANEIHIPVGRPVEIEGQSQDVIHSFWVPNLQGKMDLIPSRVNTQWIEAERPGRYRGQCAEFCGLQHAHMALWVVAESEADFDKWVEAQLQPAAAPNDARLIRGQQVFLSSSCVLCHSIRGTPAGGQNAPDLTHFGSRMTIAAGTLPNNMGNLGGWISDPQRIKPGNKMATVPIQPADLQPLLDYLESLR